MEELSEYEIESILLHRVRDVFPHHQKIVAVCDKVWNAVSNSVKKDRAQKYDYTKKIENNATIIAAASTQLKHEQNESATIVLQHKVLEKQINNTLKLQEQLKEDIEVGLSQKESYALDIVDLQHELDKSKMKKKIKWDGIRRACDAYKSALRFWIRLIDSSEACEKIRLIFFEFQKDDDPRYYVDVTRDTDLWKVEYIHPPLKPKDEERLKCVNFRKPQKDSDLTMFLCDIRKIFKLQRKS